MKKIQILLFSAILAASFSGCEKEEAVRSLDRVKLVNENTEDPKIENPEVVKDEVVKPEEEKSPNQTLDKN